MPENPPHLTNDRIADQANNPSPRSLTSKIGTGTISSVKSQPLLLNVSPRNPPEPKNKKIFPHFHAKNPVFPRAMRERGPKRAPPPVIGRTRYAPR
jgi:hypothetical protein